MSDLESIKWQVEWAKGNGINPSSNVDSDDVEWLIEQADKVERYEKALKSIYEIIGYEDDEKMVDVLIETVEKTLKA